MFKRVSEVEICPRSESAIIWKVAARQDPGYCEQILRSLICWLSRGKSVAQGKENCQLASEHKKTRDQPDMRYPKGDSNSGGEWKEEVMKRRCAGHQSLEREELT